MPETLADLAACAAPLEARLRIVRELARTVAALHARGRVHGALSPAAVLVAGGTVVLAPVPAGAPALARAGFDSPEVVRGARATRRSEAFAVGALAQLALTGRGPFDATDPLEVTRRVLFEEPRPARLDVPALSLEVEGVLASLLEKHPRRRARATDLAHALAESMPVPISSTGADLARPSTSPPLRGGYAQDERSRARGPHSSPTAIPTATPTAAPTLAPFTLSVAPPQAARSRRALARARHLARSAATRTAGWIAALIRRLPSSPLHRAGIAAVPLLVVALLLGPGSDAALAREVEAALERGDFATARQRLDAAARVGAGRPLVEKLRGDVACARGAPSECVRRYRTALAARPALRDDVALRRNARALLGRDRDCGTRRAAAQLLGELRDPGALPALEAARRSGGLLAFFCTGDSIDRAIAATRTAGPGR